MGYTNIRATMEWRDPHTKKLKYCESTKFDEHKNKFGKRLSTDSEIMTGTNVSTLPTLKIDISQNTPLKEMIYLKLL